MGEAWWWAAGSTAQLALGIASYRRGCGESGYGMPFRAFAIATLFVGSAATALTGFLHASGVNSVNALFKPPPPLQVDDMKDVGTGIRRWIKAQPRETN